MTVLPFPPRVPEAAHTLAELLARKRSPHPSCDITVEKYGRERRYLLWSHAPGRFTGEVWFGHAQHRVKRTAGVLQAKMLAAQFGRELRELLIDGWTEVS